MCIVLRFLECECVMSRKRDPGNLCEKCIEWKRTLLAALTVCEEVKVFTQSMRLLYRIASYACVMGRKIVHVYLLSDHVGIMTCFNFERAIVCPQIYGVCDAGYATFKNLRRLEQSITLELSNSPSRLLRYRQSKIPDLHISSNNQIGEGIWQGTDHMHLAL